MKRFFNRLFNSAVKRSSFARRLRVEQQCIINLLQSYHGDLKVKLYNDMWVYLPAVLEDTIQRTIASTRCFHEQHILDELNSYLPDNPVIFDVGANIGNHLLYWAGEQKAKHVFAFEPLKEPFLTMQKNVELNQLENQVSLFNVGVGRCASFAKIKRFTAANVGSTSLKESNDGDIKLITLNDFAKDNAHALTQVDLIKIDVEGFELAVLQGADAFVKHYKPLILIEIFADQFNAVNDLLKELGYSQAHEFENHNYLYRFSLP